MEPDTSPYTVYIVRTNANTLYVGIAKNLEKRLQEHKAKKSKSAKYLKSFSSILLVYSELCATKSLALKREYQLKQLSHTEKELLISSVNK
jgi:putative endonuclease